ncbi:MAG: L-iditol 2-dehydrogenase, partial [Thermoanaerobaculia bacterium]
QAWNWKGLDVINAHERDPAVYARGMREAASAVASGRLDPGPLLTHRLPLEDLPAALEMVAERPDGFLKAWVDPAAGA